MTTFELRQNPVNKLYAVFEGGEQVKDYIFTGEQDFKNELEFLGYKKPYSITVQAEDRDKIVELYLDWVNNFLTVEKFADYYMITVKRANKIINQGRKIANGR